MISIQNIVKIYNKGKTNECIALSGVSFDIQENEMVAIIGKSGSGKTTLLNLLSTIDTPTSGDIIIDDKNIGEMSDTERAKLRNLTLGIVVQDYALINHYSMLDNILLPTTAKKQPKDVKEKAKVLIEKLELGDIPLNKPVKKLSGGQKQRVAIARALINDPKIILADEPTGSIDAENSEKVINIFKQLKSEGKTIIIITHDKDIAESCDRIIELKK